MFSFFELERTLLKIGCSGDQSKLWMMSAPHLVLAGVTVLRSPGQS